MPKGYKHRPDTFSLEVRTKMSLAHGGNMNMQTCEGCGKSFHVKQSRVRGGRGKYCSRACQHAGHSEYVACLICSKSFKEEKSVLAHGWGKYCSKRCQHIGKSINMSGKNHPLYGKHLSDSHKKKISLNHADMSGENSPSWKGGISFEPYCPKFNADLKRRIRAFFDNQCSLCGKTKKENGESLSCHHIEYNKAACCDGKPVQFAALCRSCHSKTGASNDRNRWEDIMHCIILEIYAGRSYYTKEEWKELNK
jgi:hypothetical protein